MRLTTAAGEPVRMLLDQARAAPAPRSRTLDGRNGAGELVRNGVYLAEIITAFDDGRSARAIRKVVVMR